MSGPLRKNSDKEVIQHQSKAFIFTISQTTINVTFLLVVFLLLAKYMEPYQIHELIISLFGLLVS